MDGRIGIQTQEAGLVWIPTPSRQPLSWAAPQPLQASPAECVSPSCDGRGTHNSAHLLCFMGLLCVSVSVTGDMVSVWLVLREHAFLSLFRARGCLPWSASLVQVPSRPESVFILCFLPPAYHTPPPFSPSSLPAGQHLSQLLFSSRSLETWGVCFHSLWNMYTLAPHTSSFYIYTFKYSAMKNFGTPVMMFKGHCFLIPKPRAKPWDIQLCPSPFCLWPWIESLAVVFASHSVKYKIFFRLTEKNAIVF